MRFLNEDRFQLAQRVINTLNPVENIYLKKEDQKYWKEKIAQILRDYDYSDDPYHSLENILARNNLAEFGMYEKRSIFDTIYKDMNRFKQIENYKPSGKVYYTYSFIVQYIESSSEEETQFELEVNNTDFPVL